MSDVDFFLNKREKDALSALNKFYPDCAHYDNDKEAFDHLELFGLAEIHRGRRPVEVVATDTGIQVYRKQKHAWVRTILRCIVYPLIVAVITAYITAAITARAELKAAGLQSAHQEPSQSQSQLLQQ